MCICYSVIYVIHELGTIFAMINKLYKTMAILKWALIRKGIHNYV